MRVLFVKGPGDFGALEIEQELGIEEAVRQVEETGTMKKEIFLNEEDEDGIQCEIVKFGDVDPNFIEFITDNFMDYDMMKNTNFYIIEEE